jgi:hypothetical protein
MSGSRAGVGSRHFDKHRGVIMNKVMTWLVTGSARGLGRHIAEAVLTEMHMPRIEHPKARVSIRC